MKDKLLKDFKARVKSLAKIDRSLMHRDLYRGYVWSMRNSIRILEELRAEEKQEIDWDAGERSIARFRELYYAKIRNLDGEDDE